MAITHWRRLSGHETYVPTLQNPSRPRARLSRAHGHRRWPQGALGASRQGPRAAHRLTLAVVAGPLRGARLHRLRGSGAFEAIFAAGRRLDGRYLQLIAAPAARPAGRIGYVIGRKAMPRAVDRNRLRRRLREHVRAARPGLDAFDVIVRVRNPVPSAAVPAAAAEGLALLQRLLAPRAA